MGFAATLETRVGLAKAADSSWSRSGAKTVTDMRQTMETEVSLSLLILAPISFCVRGQPLRTHHYFYTLQNSTFSLLWHRCCCHKRKSCDAICSSHIAEVGMQKITLVQVASTFPLLNFKPLQVSVVTIEQAIAQIKQVPS